MRQPRTRVYAASSPRTHNSIITSSSSSIIGNPLPHPHRSQAHRYAGYQRLCITPLLSLQPPPYQHYHHYLHFHHHHQDKRSNVRHLIKYLTGCLPVCLLGCLRTCRSACLYMIGCLPVCLIACPPVYLPACLPACLAAFLSACLT